MSDEPDGEIDEQVRAGLAYVCSSYGDLAQVLGPDDPDLTAVRSAVHSGDAVRAALDRLHDRLRAAGDALGVYGQASRSARSGAAAMPGISDELGEIVYVCGSARCGRYVWLEDAEALPACSLTGMPLAMRRVG